MTPFASVVTGLGLIILGGIALLGSGLCQDPEHRKPVTAAWLWLSGTVTAAAGWAEGTAGWAFMVLGRHR